MPTSIKALRDELFTINTIVHEIVHQWTGVKMLNDWWSGFWINEGITAWMQGEVISKLISLGRIPTEAYDVSRELKYYDKERKLIFEDMQFTGSSMSGELQFANLKTVPEKNELKCFDLKI